MNFSAANAHPTNSRPSVLRVGFVALNDAAPFLAAKERGLFEKHGLEIELSLELGWATVRDKIVGRQLDAAHALGPMPFALSLGLGSVACPCLTGLVLNLEGNGITLSRELHERGANDARTLREVIRENRGKRTYTFGAVFPFSAHWTLLRRWLRQGGIDPEKDVKLVIVPPALLFRTLETGHLDGYCVGEPWNTLAVHRKAGAFVALSTDIEPGHPEKVLLVRRDFAENRHEDHIRLIAALLEACRFRDDPENSDELVRILVKDGRIGVSETVLRKSLESRSAPAGNNRKQSDPDTSHACDPHRPDSDKAEWIIDALLENNTVPKVPSSPGGLAKRIFREDLYEEARHLATPPK